jgi:Protein of unknown function (DUF1153)
LIQKQFIIQRFLAIILYGNNLYFIAKGGFPLALYTHTQATDHIIGPDGRKLTLADLPPADTTRWVIRRKAEVVAAVRGGLFSVDEALNFYKLSSEEFDSWLNMIDEYGIAGLRTTRVRHYRNRKH